MQTKFFTHNDIKILDMKHLTFLVLLLFLGHGIFAQVVETEMRMSDGVNSALEVDLKGNAKDAEKIWKKYAKKYGKLEWDRKNKEHVLFNVVVEDIDEEYPVTVVSTFTNVGDESKGTFWIKMDGEYVNSADKSKEIQGAGKWIQAYAYEVESKFREEEIKDEEGVLKGFDKDLKKLTKQNENFHKDIAKAKEAIAKAEAGIEQNLTDQASKNEEIENQKSKIEALKEALKNVGKS